MKDPKTILNLKMILGISVLFLFISTAAWAASPVIFYSDMTAGPNTGGQNNNGVFVTIWGNNFGSTQGSSYVTVGGGKVNNYPTWTNTMICFQLGPNTVTGNIVLATSNGNATGPTFTVQAGNIYFVQPGASTNGSGTYTSPFNHIYYAEQAVVAGDAVYVEAGTIFDEIDGQQYWHSLLMPQTSGTQTSPISWIAYPGATVTLKADGAADTWSDGGGADGDTVQYIFRGDNATWQTFSKFYLVFTGSTNLVNVADSDGEDGWKFVGNNSTATYYTYCQLCVSGAHGQALGNEIHDSGSLVTNGNERHSIYVEAGANPFEVGWNYMHGNENTGWEISNYHNGPRIGTIHDNLIIAGSSGSVKGILADGCGDTPSPDTLSTMETNVAEVYNNVIVNAGQNEDGGALQANCGTNYIYNNTIYGSGTETDGVIQFENGGIGPGGGNPVEYVANNIIYANNSGLYLSDATGVAPIWTNFALLTNNNYYGAGNGPSEDANALNTNPQFVSPSTSVGGNFQLQSTSPDINTGFNTTSIVTTDFNGLVRRSTPSIGAYEYTSAPSAPVVAITSPANGINISTGSNISITAAASEANGTIANISIYNGGTLLGSSNSSPYTYVMSVPPVGIYTLTAVATDANGVSTTSSAVVVTVLNLSLLPSSPVVTITSPASGSSYTAGSNVTVTTTASETNGTIANIYLYNGSGLLLGSSSTSPYTFVESNMAAGGYSFYAVATDTTGISTTSSTITVTVTSTSAPVVAIASPANGTTYSQGSTFTITANASETNGSIAQVQYYTGSYMLASSTTPPYTASWTNATTGSFPLTAKAIDANGVSTMSSPITVSVTTATASPVVSLTSPANSSSYTAGSSITLTASASETNGTISKVQFYNGSTLLGTSTSSPYTFSWTNVSAGNYSLTAKATDANGISTTSSAEAVSVIGLPTVSLSSNNTTFTAPAIITLTATASEANGTISKVEFFNGSTLLGTATSSPYTYSWSNVSAGNYSLTAEAFDNNSNTATSTAVAITVTIAGVAPSITAQPVSMTVTAPATAAFSVVATGTPAATFQWMQSVNGGAFTNIGGATAASYTTAATTAANSGTQFKCVVTNASGSVTSNAATLTVNPTPVAPSITAQPVSMTVTAPATAAFSVAAAGTPAPTFQWMQSVNGGAFTNIGGATAASYTTAATTAANSGTQFKCVVTNASGSVTSNAATLTVNPTPVAPSITAQPVSMTVTAPATAAFSVVATGTPAATFQWMQSVNGGAFTNIGGATAASYTTAATTAANSGTQFKCVVTNASGSVTSNAATLTVTVNATPSLPTVSLTSPSNNSTFSFPGTIFLSANASETNGNITQVQFFNRSTLLYTATSNPFNYTWTTYLLPGNYTITAQATDSRGVVAVSAPVTITISLPSRLGSNPSGLVVAITSPANSSSISAGSNLNIAANASENNGSIAEVYFYNGSSYLGSSSAAPYNFTWANVPAGNYTLTAEAVDATGHSVTSNPVAVTVNGSTPPAPVVSIINPTNGNKFTKGSNFIITANASEISGTGSLYTSKAVPTIVQVQFYNGSTLLGTSTTSPYTFDWSNVPAGTYTLIAIATDSNGVTTSSSPVSVTVVAPSLPVTAITSPANGSSSTAGSSLSITASASETNGTITQVQFFNGSTLLGTDTTAPYSFTWSNVPAGTYSLTVVATDTTGVSTTSTAVSVTVNPSLPIAAITSPANGSSLIAGSSLSITASASETNGTIAQVQFFNGSTLLGTDTTAPYSFTWSNVPVGSYSLTAVATDIKGVSTTSAAVSVSVNLPLPTAVITSPANGSSLTAASNLTITANASETNGTIAQVKFYDGSTLLGTDTTAPYSFTWSNVPAGSYSLTVVATDITGVSTISNPVAVTVNAVATIPVVAITNLTNGTSVLAGSTLNINVSATGSNSPINQVKIYNGSMLLYTAYGTSSSSYNWRVPLPGIYALSAQAIDSNGNIIVSVPVNVSVVL